jgi:hypothetical protein
VNTGKQLWFYITTIAFALFFLLHGINEQFGLLSNGTIGELVLYYLLVSLIAAVIAKVIFRNNERALVFAFVLLCIFFFFGAVKDVIKGSPVNSFAHYSILLPAIVIVAGFSFLIISRRNSLRRAVLFIGTLLSVCIILETGTFCYNIFSHKEKQKDLGDMDHELISNINITDSIKRPSIFWIVMDEYSGNTALKKRWDFNNPLDSLLREKAFFAADSAKSPYNYTHYSLVSSLDMTYLRELKEHSEIGFRDIVRGNISLEETNTLKLLKMAGYNIHNYTIYNIADYPTKAHAYFVDADFRLVDNQTLTGRIRQDLGWKFVNYDRAEGIRQEYKYRLSLVQEGLDAAKKAVSDTQPSFFMFHYMLTHEPFLYKNDGLPDTTSGFNMAPEKYIASIKYANNVLTTLIDSLKSVYRNKELVIILQGDHGYKYDEKDPLFDQEGCSILYSVYCSDLNYKQWNNTFNSVNTFRVLFNKYFHTNLPILENLSFNLYYR